MRSWRVQPDKLERAGCDAAADTVMRRDVNRWVGRNVHEKGDEGVRGRRKA